MAFWKSLLLFSGLAAATLIERADEVYPSYEKLAKCPGYKARNVKERHNSLTADLTLSGRACNAYGDDLKDLTLEVTYETGQYTIGSPIALPNG